MEKRVWNGTKWGRELFFPTNPDLADILDDTDFDFDNLYFFFITDFQISGFPDSWIPRLKAAI